MAKPTIEQAKAFCEVADLRSYAEAGERLGHSRMSVIRLVDRFGKSVGRSDLFTPSRRGRVTLTAAGRELLVTTRRFVAAADALTEGRTEIRFSAYPSIVRQVLSRAPDLLEGQMPLLLDDVSEERRVDGGVGLVNAVATGRLDLAAAPSKLFDSKDLKSQGLRELSLYRWRLRVVLPEKHPDRSKRSIAPAQLAELRISAAPHGHHSRHLLDSAFGTAGVPLRVALESSSQHMLRSVAYNSSRHAAVIPDDAFGAPDRELGPHLTDGSHRAMGGEYSLYLRIADRKDTTQAARRELAVSEVAARIQRELKRPGAGVD
jgi:DNA-binding transcriptional LysR family regulator